MPHGLIVGTTTSGKSRLGWALAKAGQRVGRKSIVLDSTFGEWSADYMTTDKDEFLRIVWASEGCNVFVDEAGDEIGRYDKVMNQLATKGRHWGHVCHFITQRGMDLSRTVRAQCHFLCCFASDADDAKGMSQQWLEPELLKAPDLQKGKYLYKRRFEPVQQRSIF